MEPLDVVVVGSALNDSGFMAYNTVEGLGLNTFGQLWPCTGIWAPLTNSALQTTWTKMHNPTVNTETCID